MNNASVPPTNHIKVLDGNQGWVGLLDHMGNESTITNSARVSFDKRKDNFDEKDEKLLKYLIDNKHLTPLEHVKFTFSVHCPIFVARQWHRHRMASINEISRRYTEINLEIYQPEVYRKQSDNNKQASIDGTVVENNDELVKEANELNQKCLDFYNKLIENGVCREQARGYLPQNMFTTFWWTVDLRNLLHFIELRDDEHAQKEIREYAKAMKELVRPIVPHVVEYFENKDK